MRKKGVILVIVMIFLIIGMITGIGLYGAVYNLYRMQSINAVARVKGYYAALGALRSLCNVIPPVAMTIDKNHNIQLWTDLGLTGEEKVNISVSAPDAANQYIVTAIYSSN